MAQAQALPMLGMQLGLMLGPQLQAALIDSLGVRRAWLVTGGMFSTALLLTSEVATRVATPSGKRNVHDALTMRQKKLALETQAEPVEKFVELACADLKASLSPEGPASR